MRKSRIDSPFMEAGMPKAYSRDLRERVITAVETGASRREAAERFEVSVASAVKWLQRWYRAEEQRAEAARQERFAVGRVRGRDFGSDRPTAGPDLGRNGCRTAQATDKTSRGSLWRFLDRHNIMLEKSAASSPTAASRCRRERATAGYESKVCLILPGWCLSTRPPSAGEHGETERASPACGVRVD